MTAGNGIAHAEESRSADSAQHGAQLWIAQPDATRHGAAEFQHLPDLPRIEFGAVGATILLGESGGARSPGRTDTRLIGVALEGLDTGTSEIPLDPTFEYGVVVLDGSLSIRAEPVRPGELVYLGRGRDELSLGVTSTSSPDEIEAAAHDWNTETARFGVVASDLSRIAAPAH